MSNDFPIPTYNDRMEKGLQIMYSINIRYLPVMEHNQLVGIISIMDLVNSTLLQQKEAITQLTAYASGRMCMFQ